MSIQADWKIIQGKVKQKWATLMDDDCAYAEGKVQELVGRIQKRNGEMKEAVEKGIKKAPSAPDCGCKCE